MLSAHPFQFRQPLVDQRRSSLGVFDHEVVHIYAAFQHLLVAKKFECDCAAFCLVSDQVGSFLILNLPLTRIGHQAAVRPLPPFDFLTKIRPQMSANQTFDKPEILGHTYAHHCWGFRFFSLWQLSNQGVGNAFHTTSRLRALEPRHHGASLMSFLPCSRFQPSSLR